jgi:DNA-binding NarL/FixJ family response regulator
VSLIVLDRSEETPPTDRPAGRHGWAGSAEGSSSNPASSAGQPAEASRPGSRVLVVDDTRSIRTEIRLLLEDSGFSVVGEGSHGAEGVMLARELRPDVVVMDVRMPILDGIAATGYITRELPDTRVIVFSAFEDQELAEAALAAGARAFLTKGASPAEIADAVSDATSDG